MVEAQCSIIPVNYPSNFSAEDSYCSLVMATITTPGATLVLVLGVVPDRFCDHY
jgi:hypothetical protein